MKRNRRKPDLPIGRYLIFIGSSGGYNRPMNQLNSSPANPLSPHRLADIPIMYSRPTKTPFLLRLQACCWRAVFSCWIRLRSKAGQTHRLRSWPNDALS